MSYLMSLPEELLVKIAEAVHQETTSPTTGPSGRTSLTRLARTCRLFGTISQQILFRTLGDIGKPTRITDRPLFLLHSLANNKGLGTCVKEVDLVKLRYHHIQHEDITTNKPPWALSREAEKTFSIWAADLLWAFDDDFDLPPQKIVGKCCPNLKILSLLGIEIVPNFDKHLLYFANAASRKRYPSLKEVQISFFLPQVEDRMSARY